MVVAATAVVSLTACSENRERPAADGDLGSSVDAGFYDVPNPLPAGEPGAVIRSVGLHGAPDGMRAWRILYHSRDVDGADIAVSGVVLAPDGGAARSNRSVVSWGHPTTGAAQRCAPSLGMDPFATVEGARALVEAGHVVVATDYPGLGAPGPNQYVVGTSEGNSVLDAARAARSIPETGAGDRLLLWGYSQGGHAVLFAAQDAPTYAPELELKAVAVAAPAVELGELLDDDEHGATGVMAGAYAFDAYQRTYEGRYPDLALDRILTPAGVEAVPKIVELCSAGDHRALGRIATSLIGAFLAHDPSQTEPWATLLRENTPGAVAIAAPVLVAQGAQDDLVRPEATERYVQHLCSQGVEVDARVYPGQGHSTVAWHAFDDVVEMFSDALDGRPPTSTC